MAVTERNNNWIWDIGTLMWKPEQQAILDGGSVTITGAGLATSANQTNGSQETQIVDGSGNVISATSNALDVNIKSQSASVVITGAVLTI